MRRIDGDRFGTKTDLQGSLHRLHRIGHQIDDAGFDSVTDTKLGEGVSGPEDRHLQTFGRQSAPDLFRQEAQLIEAVPEEIQIASGAVP